MIDGYYQKSMDWFKMGIFSKPTWPIERTSSTDASHKLSFQQRGPEPLPKNPLSLPETTNNGWRTWWTTSGARRRCLTGAASTRGSLTNWLCLLVDTPGKEKGRRGVIGIKETRAPVDLHDEGVGVIDVFVVVFIKNGEPTWRGELCWSFLLIINEGVEGLWVELPESPEQALSKTGVMSRTVTRHSWFWRFWRVLNQMWDYLLKWQLSRYTP